MKRRLLNLAAVVSLVLGIGTGVLWLLGLRGESHVALGTLQRGLGVINSDSCVTFWIGNIAMPESRRTISDAEAPGLLYRTMTGPPRTYVLFVRHGLLMLLTLPPALAWLLTARLRERMRRRHEGLCSACGYDLRASTDKCPECGTAIPPQAKARGATA